ncbi:MAG: J domain-containing protein [Candidatus Sericytochromatia bacterium]
MNILEKLDSIPIDILKEIDSYTPTTFSYKALHTGIYNYSRSNKVYAFLCQMASDIANDKKIKEVFLNKKNKINSNIESLFYKYSDKLDEIKKKYNNTYFESKKDFLDLIDEFNTKQVEVCSLENFDFDDNIFEAFNSILKLILLSLSKKNSISISNLEQLNKRLDKENLNADILIEILFLLSNKNNKNDKDLVVFNNYDNLKTILTNEVQGTAFWDMLKTGLAGGVLSFFLPPPLKILLTLGASVYTLIKSNAQRTNVMYFVSIIFDVYVLDAFYKKGYYNNSNNDFNQNKPDISEKECYEILNCSKNVSNEELKKIYKDLMKLYHPDKIQGKDIPPALVELAEKEIKKINKAYDFLKELRGI